MGRTLGRRQSARLRPLDALVAGVAAESLGQGVWRILLPFAALSMTGSPLAVGIAAGLFACGWPVFGLLAGYIADRGDRRLISTAANLVRAVALAILVLALAHREGGVLVLYGAALVLGACEAAAGTATPGLITHSVPRAELARANARVKLARQGGDEFVGPALGGAIVNASVAVSAALTGLFFAVSSILFVLLKGDFKPKPAARRPFPAELLEGAVIVWRHPTLRVLALMVVALAGSWGLWLAVMPSYLALSLAPAEAETIFSLLLMSYAAGGLAGNLVYMPLQRRLGLRAVVAADCVGTLVLLLAPALSRDVAVLVVAMAICGFGGALWGIAVTTLRQEIAPDHALGKVTAAFRLVGYSATPVLALAGGAAAELMSLEGVFLLAMPLPAAALAAALALDLSARSQEGAC